MAHSLDLPLRAQHELEIREREPLLLVGSEDDGGCAQGCLDALPEEVLPCGQSMINYHTGTSLLYTDVFDTCGRVDRVVVGVVLVRGSSQG